MRTAGPALLVGLLAACMTACSGPAGVTCTEMGSPTGIAVTVEKDIAPTLRDLVLTVCVGTTCLDHPVELTPGSTSVPDPCPSPSAPDTSCSATATPDGTKIGFVDLTDLKTGTISVRATAMAGANELKLSAAVVTVRETYPNGAQCPAGGNQAAITLSGSGIR